MGSGGHLAEAVHAEYYPIYAKERDLSCTTTSDTEDEFVDHNHDSASSASHDETARAPLVDPASTARLRPFALEPGSDLQVDLRNNLAASFVFD